jgi:hypothetical protein
MRALDEEQTKYWELSTLPSPSPKSRLFQILSSNSFTSDQLKACWLGSLLAEQQRQFSEGRRRQAAVFSLRFSHHHSI